MTLKEVFDGDGLIHRHKSVINTPVTSYAQV